jgi:hypothetical protein
MPKKKKKNYFHFKGKKSFWYYLGLSCLVLGIVLTLTVGILTVFNYVYPGSAAGYQPGSGNVRGVTLTQYIISIYNYAASIIALLAVIVIIVAGYRYMSAMGNPQYLSEAKAMSVGAITGLVLVLLSYLILSTLNPATVKW